MSTQQVCPGGNQKQGSGDLIGMASDERNDPPLACEQARELISARIDNELTSFDGDRLDGHLHSCRDCSVWEDDAHALRRASSIRLAPSEAATLAAEERTNRILARVGVPDSGAGEWIRYALGVVAATVLVLNIPLLVSASTGDGPSHDSRHLGAFGVALGAGMLWAAVRPERSIGLVPMAGALAAAMVIGALVDLGAGRSTALAEAGHLLELTGLALLWLLSGGRHRLRATLAAHRRRPAMRSL